MKKIFAVFVVMMAFAVSGFAEMPIAINALPTKILEFIAFNFPGKTAAYAEGDWDEIEVYLTDRTEIKFYPDGTWDEIKCYAGVPSTIFPQAVNAKVASSFPGAKVIEAERERGNLKLKLSNRMEMYFGANGAFLGQKFDD